MCALACLCAWPAHAKRIALVIGNDRYQYVAPLAKAGNDADAVARELQAAGFEVARYRDLEFKAMVKAFEGFYDRIGGGDEIAVFYAGHGVQTRTGNYLLPVDLDGETESQVEKTSYSVNDMLEELDKAKPRFTLIIIDACRDNPLRSRGRTIGATRGLSPPEIAKGQFAMFSASRGQQALDSLNDRDPNPNGVFTRELVTRMRQPGLSIDVLGIEVRTSVEQLAASVGHQQRPYLANEAVGNFYLISPIAAPVAPTPQTAIASAEAVREDRFWDDAKFAGNKEGYEAYLDTYPRGRYASLARANIARLAAAAAAVESIVTTLPNAAVPRLAAAPANAATTPSAARAAPSAQPAPSRPTTATAPGAVTSPSTVTPAPPIVAAPPTPATPGRVDVTLPNGDRYEGDVVGIVRTGQGRYVFANGDRYTGGFVDDRFNGKGLQTLTSGDNYDGEFRNGVKYGRGVFRYANGDRYEGEFVDNDFSGKGVLVLIIGDRYEGEFRANVKHGRGVHTFASGERYEGEFAAGVQSGAGTHFYRNGDKYAGSFASGVRNGNGIYTFANGETQEMEFVNGVEKRN